MVPKNFTYSPNMKNPNPTLTQKTSDTTQQS